MEFYPPPRLVPDGLVTDEFILEPLTIEHVEVDYSALMDSAEMLRLWSGTAWPADDFTLAENWEDLDRHAREHQAREAFTYTVLDLTRTWCLGCVYIQPPALFGGDAADWSPEVSAEAALVGFWVRAPRLEDGLDKRLLDALRSWLDTRWDFQEWFLAVRQANTQQRELLDDSSLVLAYTGLLGNRGRILLYRSD